MSIHVIVMYMYTGQKSWSHWLSHSWSVFIITTSKKMTALYDSHCLIYLSFLYRTMSSPWVEKTHLIYQLWKITQYQVNTCSLNILLKLIQVDVVMESFIKEMREAGNDYHLNLNSAMKDCFKILITWQCTISLSKWKSCENTCFLRKWAIQRSLV